MRAFAKVTPIARLSVEARVLYTAFCAFMLIGFGTSVWLYADDGLGTSSDTTRAYYLGEDATSRSATPAPEHDGPMLQLPGEAALPEVALRIAKPKRQVIETFHFHVFSIPVCLLIVGHIFMMVGLTTKVKVVTLVIATLSTLVHMLVPVLVRFRSPDFASWMFPSALLMTLMWLLLTVVPIIEMWRPRASAVD